MGNIESQMQAFEESAESSKMEIEENQKKLDEFENRFENERNEGLFFKSLGESKPVNKSIAKAAAEKMNELNKQTAGTETRRNIYLALIGLVSISIVESLISPSFDWRKGAVLGLILVGLLTQLTFYMGNRRTNIQPNTPWSSSTIIIRCTRPAFHLGINL